MMKLELKKPITFKVSYSNGIWEIYCKGLDSYSMSDVSCGHAVDQFFDAMESYYDVYVNDTPDKFTKDGLELRKRLKKYFKVI